MLPRIRRKAVIGTAWLPKGESFDGFFIPIRGSPIPGVRFRTETPRTAYLSAGSNCSTAAAAVVLGGCASSPEAARVQGNPGADQGNHGNPLVLIAPPERIDRVDYDDPYDDYNLHADYNLPYNPPATSEDTPQP